MSKISDERRDMGGFILGGFVGFRGGVKMFEKAVTRLIDELGDSDD